MKKWTLILLVSLIALAFMVMPAAAKTIRTEYEGVEYCGPLEGAREWISEDGVLHSRGGQSACIDTGNDARISGDVLITVNYNFQFTDPPVMVYGPMWGEARISNDGGYWQGRWVGERTELEGYSYIQVVMRGYEDYEGLQARVTYIRESPYSGDPYQIHGVIMEPGGK